MILWHLTHRKNVESILEKGLLKMSGEPTWHGRNGQDIRKYKNCIYAWEHSSDALMFIREISGLENADKVLICFESDARRTQDENCECQLNGMAVVIREPVPPSKIKAIYYLSSDGYYKSHGGTMTQHVNVPKAKPANLALAIWKTTKEGVKVKFVFEKA